MAELNGNLLVAQSGGPTAVINASLAGVIQEAGRHECIEEIYGGLNGILGILNEELIDINEEKSRTIEGLKYPRMIDPFQGVIAVMGQAQFTPNWKTQRNLDCGTTRNSPG